MSGAVDLDEIAKAHLTEANELAVANRGRDGSVEVIAAAADAIVTAIFAVRDEVRELRRDLERRS